MTENLPDTAARPCGNPKCSPTARPHVHGTGTENTVKVVFRRDDA